MNKKILQYDTVFEKESDGGYSVWVPDLAGCSSQGDNLEEAIENIKEAIELHLEEATEGQIKEGKTHCQVPNSLNKYSQIYGETCEISHQRLVTKLYHVT